VIASKTVESLGIYEKYPAELAGKQGEEFLTEALVKS
jgi:hypothetical protein